MTRASALLLLVLAPGVAAASPWALPEKRLVLNASIEYQWASEEFLDEPAENPRRARPFPLEGSLSVVRYELGARYGLGAGFDVELSFPISVVSYDSDPVILLPQPPNSPQSSIDFFQENVIDLAQTRAGVGDINLGVRQQWLDAPLAFSTTLRFKIPSGYQGPVGTFGEFPSSAEAFAADPARFVRPGNVEDDVTLGDGQLDIEAMGHFGWASRSGWFTRAALGYAIRFDRAADEFRAEAKVGRLIGRRWLINAGANLRTAVEPGRLIGVSVSAIDPELPAEAYLGTNNLLLRELRLERDLLQVGGGIIYRVTNRLEINASYDRIIWGRNVSASNAFRLSFAGRIDL